MLVAEQTLMLLALSDIDEEAFRKQITKWSNNINDDFYRFFVVIMVNNVLNFVMTMFAVYMLVKMSKATWSIKFQDSAETRKTTQMDREVAAKWFDKMMLDTEFVFRRFMHNIPRCS